MSEQDNKIRWSEMSRLDKALVVFAAGYFIGAMLFLVSNG